MTCRTCGGSGVAPCPWCSDYPPGQCRHCGGTGVRECATLTCWTRRNAGRFRDGAEAARAAGEAGYLNVTPRFMGRLLREVS